MKSLLALIIFSSLVFAQKFSMYSSFGKFGSAVEISINSSGRIYVIDDNANEIYLLDTLGNMIIKNGGFGWNEAEFDQPADVFANSLSVYVADENNHRIQRFDKDLNFISQLSTRESDNISEQFGYPLSCATSNQGELFILDSENIRIIKVDIFGNFIQNFGGYDYGKFALSNPVKLAISDKNDIYVLDENQIVVFDQFGNGIKHIKLNENFKSIKILFNNLLLCKENKILQADFNAKELKFSELILSGFDKNIQFQSATMFNSKLYVLTKTNILVFKKDKISD